MATLRINQVKRLLLILMVLASVASAHPRSDAELKALIVGTWTCSGGDYDSRYTTYQEDGVELVGVHNYRMKWEVKDGELVEIESPEAAGIAPSEWEEKSAGYLYVYTILFLTKHELLVQDKKSKIYTFMSR